MRSLPGVLWLLAPLLLPQGSVAGQESSAFTSTVFRRYADRVVRIQVVESGSAAKASVGSGFFVTSRGHIVTNYHVVLAALENGSLEPLPEGWQYLGFIFARGDTKGE